MSVTLTLTDLSDELLLNILKRLDSISILECQESCQRLHNVTCDKDLWKTVDFTSRRLTCASLNKILKPYLDPTVSLSIRGTRNSLTSNKSNKLLTKHVLTKINKFAPSLESLSIKEATFCATEISIKDFSAVGNLKFLSLNNCEFLNKPTIATGPWFKSLTTFLPLLETLILTGSTFIDDHDMMTLAKAKHLKKLHLTSCIRIGLAMPYLAIAFRFGFRKLESLDLRGTSIHDNDLQSVLQTGLLKELYLGPMGKVNRQTINEDNIHSLIMSDPRREENVTEQVLVVNIGPNGPSCHQAEDHELNSMGLGWVVKQKQLMAEQRKQNAGSDHMFIGKDGKIIKASDDEAGPSTSGNKRKADDSAEESAAKRSKLEEPCTRNEPSNRDVGSRNHIGCFHNLENVKPDAELSDFMASLIVRYAMNNISVLHLAGCSITNRGLEDLLAGIPSLVSVNIMFTNVTQECIERLRPLYKNCNISDARPKELKTGECSIFCCS